MDLFRSKLSAFDLSCLVYQELIKAGYSQDLSWAISDTLERTGRAACVAALEDLNYQAVQSARTNRNGYMAGHWLAGPLPRVTLPV